MFNQGGGNSQSGMLPYNVMPPPQFGQLPPPPRPHCFPQGSQPPTGRPPNLPPHPGQLSMLPSYHQQGQQASHLPGMHNVRMPNTSQPYSHSPVSGIQGNLPMPHGYGNAGQQNSQHPSYIAQGRPPPPPPPAGSPGQAMQPPGGLPPSSSQCHTVYNAPVHRPTQQPVGVQGFQQIPRLPPPPPPVRTFDSSGNSVQSIPFSATITPCQPSTASYSSCVPPPSSGSAPVPTDSNNHCNPCNEWSKHSGLNLTPSSSIAEVSPAKHDTPTCESNLNSKHENDGDGDGDGVKNDLPLGPSGLSSHLVSAHNSYSPFDSDMEMEDDITHPEYEQPVEYKIEGQVQGQDMPCGGHATKADDPVTAGRALNGDKENSTTLASAAPEHTNSDPYIKHAERDCSFELLQDCSSDDNLEDNKESLQMDAFHETDSSPMAVDSRNLHQVSLSNLEMDVGSKSPCANEKDDKLSVLNMPDSTHELSSCLEREVTDISPTSLARDTTAKQIDTELETEVSAICATSSMAHLEEGISGTMISATSNVKYQKGSKDKDLTSVSKIQKIDKYGRLFREGANDSDSEDSWDAGKRRRRRSHSRSRSPVERRRRRRSPVRKRDRRSRSRSWSPRNQRSRSRSPSFRHIGEFNGNRRQDRGICYDFRRGKCYRGASCRYRHYNHENSDRSRPGRKHPDSDVPPSSKSSITCDEMKRTYKESDHDNESMCPEKHKTHDEHGSHISAERDGYMQEKGSALGAPSPYVISSNSNQSVDHNANITETSRGADVKVMDTTGVQENLTNPTILRGYADQSHSGPSDTVRVRQADQQPHQMDNSVREDKTSNTPSKNSSQTSTYPSLLTPAGVNVCVTQQITSFSTQSSSLETCYMMRHQVSHFSATQNSSWASFQPSPLNLQSDSQSAGTGTVLPGVLQFQQSHLPQNNGLDSMIFSRPYSTESPSYSQAGQLPPRLPPVQELSQPLSHAQDIKPLPQCTSAIASHPYFQQHQPPSGLNDSASESSYGHSGKMVSNYPPNAHYNPYASTFGDKYDHPLSLTHSSVDRKGYGIGPGPDSGRHAGQILPHSGGDLYDPLFDSIEPISKSPQKLDDGWKQEPSNGLSGSNQPLVADETKGKEFCNSALDASVDNEEFGETADAEVGDVDDGSQSSFNVAANIDMGEVEIDQIKSPGKKKKTKDSRSMKLFRVSLAEFVKGVLKPSWRQGNMSKEAFKTVVKKTVDKVSGTMKSHHIPKSQIKINHYIDSSERKLTKLVMGYVDKYAKG